jgi:hypothetical protein
VRLAPAASHEDLAGRALTAYPFFHRVHAFGPDEPVEVALDPGLWPDLVGTTCDLYVVRTRSTAAWQADPTLVDVRAGGPQEVEIGPTSVEENTWVAAAAGDGQRVAIDGDPVPPSAAGYYYLVAATLENGESSLGRSSVDLDPGTAGDQLERANAAPCP